MDPLVGHDTISDVVEGFDSPHHLLPKLIELSGLSVRTIFST
jgi:hypothetical protein